MKLLADTGTALWLVVENTITKYDPRAASLLCVVRVSDSDIERLGETLRKYSMVAFKETYGHYFHREGWTKRKPISLQQFTATIGSYSPYDIYSIRDAFKEDSRS